MGEARRRKASDPTFGRIPKVGSDRKRPSQKQIDEWFKDPDLRSFIREQWRLNPRSKNHADFMEGLLSALKSKITPKAEEDWSVENRDNPYKMVIGVNVEDWTLWVSNVDAWNKLSFTPGTIHLLDTSFLAPNWKKTPFDF